jgi:hypothetical protein
MLYSIFYLPVVQLIYVLDKLIWFEPINSRREKESTKALALDRDGKHSDDLCWPY